MKHVYYGWWVVLASFVVAFYVAGTVFYGFTAFIEPLADEFGWSYTQISLAASLRGLEMGLMAPLVGILVDRIGSRKLLFSGILVHFGNGQVISVGGSQRKGPLVAGGQVAKLAPLVHALGRGRCPDGMVVQKGKLADFFQDFD